MHCTVYNALLHYLQSVLLRPSGAAQHLLLRTCPVYLASELDHAGMMIAATGHTVHAVFVLCVYIQANMQKTLSKQVVNKAACYASYTKQVLSQAARPAVTVLQRLFRAYTAIQIAKCRSSLQIRLQGLEGLAQCSTSVLQGMIC